MLSFWKKKYLLFDDLLILKMDSSIGFMTFVFFKSDSSIGFMKCQVKDFDDFHIRVYDRFMIIVTV